MIQNLVPWETVYIFISSTFQDMHAERDHLVKRVFPELRRWCAERRIHLVDVDLRWGVTEEDSVKNRRVVDVCLQNIDRCRPFFVCFLGQRRGWVPTRTDVSGGTLQNFPGIRSFLGKASVTELEIIHALIQPMQEGREIVDALIYARDPSYLNDIPDPEHRKVFESPSGLINSPKKELEKFKKSIRDTHTVYDYTCRWNPKLSSPELMSVNGMDLSSGRIDEMKVDGVSLEVHITERLKEMIEKRYPDRKTAEEGLSDLEKELLHQDAFLFQAGNSYLRRIREEEKIFDYLYQNKDNNVPPYILCAEAGSGKTSLLAYVAGQIKDEPRTVYRFLGTSYLSGRPDLMLRSIAEQLVENGFLTRDQYETSKDQIELHFSGLLADAAKNMTSDRPLILILDALDQCLPAGGGLWWIPEMLPGNVRMVLSIKKDTNSTALSELTERGFSFHTLPPMNDVEDRMTIIRQYMGQFLKDVDDKQMASLLNLPGSTNPLYLKIVLNELRQHGSFETLMQLIRNDYGKTPEDAFNRVLLRLETEPLAAGIRQNVFSKAAAGLLAYSLRPLADGVIADLLTKKEPNPSIKEQARDSEEIWKRKLQPYLVRDGIRCDYLYDSLRRAVKKRYETDRLTFHSLLAGRLLDEMKDSADPDPFARAWSAGMRELALHMAQLDREHVIRFFEDPRALKKLIELIGPVEAAKAYTLAAETLDKEKDEDSAGQINAVAELTGGSGAAAASANVFDYFYSLSRLPARTEGSLIDRMIKSAAEKMHGQYFRPLTGRIYEGMFPVREYSFPTVGTTKSSTHHNDFSCVCGSFMLHTDFARDEFSSRTRLTVTDLRSGQLANIITLEGRVFGALHFCVSEDKLYYLIDQRNKAEEEWKFSMSVRHLPDLSLIASGLQLPAASERSLRVDMFHVYQGQAFVIRELSSDMNRTEEISVVSLETSEEILRLDVKEDPPLYIQAEAGFLCYDSDDRTRFHVWDLMTQTEYLPDLALEPVDSKSATWACGAVGEDLLVLRCAYDQSLGRICNHALFYRRSADGLSVSAHELDHSGSLNRIAKPILANDLILLGVQEELHVFTVDLQYLGWKRYHRTSGGNWKAAPFENDLLFLESSGYSLYKKQDLLRGLRKDENWPDSYSFSQTIVRGERLFLLHDKCEVLDLASGRQTGSVFFAPKQSYEWDGRSNYILGQHSEFAEHDCDISMITLSDRPRYQYLKRQAYSRNEDLYNVFPWQDGQFLEFSCFKGPEDGDTRFRPCFRFYSLLQPSVLLNQWEPEVVFSRNWELFTDPVQGVLLMCTGCRNDHDDLWLQIWSVKERSILWQKEIGEKVRVQRVPGESVPNQVLLVLTDLEEVGGILLEISLSEGTCRELAVEGLSQAFMSEVPGSRTEDSFALIYYYSERLFAQSQKHIAIYSRKEHALVHDIAMPQELAYTNDVVEKFGAYLFIDTGRFLTAVSKEDGRTVLRQHLPKTVDMLRDCPGKPYVFLHFTDMTYEFYTLSNIRTLT